MDKKIKEFKDVLDKMNISDKESKKYVDELVKYNKFLKNAVTKK